MKSKQCHAYLYADGHAVIIYEQRVKLGGSVQCLEYAVIHEQWASPAACHFKGRLCFSRYESVALMKLARDAVRISVAVPSVDYGSDNTKKLGVRVGSLAFDFPGGGSLSWCTCPDLISANFTYQPDYDDKFNPDASEWGGVRVASVKRLAVKETKAA